MLAASAAAAAAAARAAVAAAAAPPPPAAKPNFGLASFVKTLVRKCPFRVRLGVGTRGGPFGLINPRVNKHHPGVGSSAAAAAAAAAAPAAKPNFGLASFI